MPSEKAIRQIRTACRADPMFFASRWVKTRDPQAENPIRQFPAYDFLNGFFRHACDHQLLAVEKSRQMLLTWAAVVFSVWQCLFFEHRHWIIQSEKEDKAKALIHPRANVILENIPRGLVDVTWRLKTDRIQFSNGSLLQAVPQGPQQIASYNPSGVIMDEMALQEYAKEAYQTLLPSLRTGGQMIGVSTPRGENFFYTFTHDIKAVKTLRIHYTHHPVYAAEAAKMGGWPNWKAAMMVKWGFDEDMWQREMEINYGIEPGKPVFRPPFRRDWHVATKTILADPLMPIQRGWDFGFRRPACVWTQKARNGQWLILREFLGKDMQLAQFVREVIRLSRKLAPGVPQRAFEDYCDPSGLNQRDAGPMSVEVLHENGIYPRNTSAKVPLKGSVEIIQRNLNLVRLNGVLRPGTLIDPSCALIIKAFAGAYVEAHGDLNKAGGSKTKFTGGRTVHLIDGLRYIAAGTFRLGAIRRVRAKSA